MISGAQYMAILRQHGRRAALVAFIEAAAAEDGVSFARKRRGYRGFGVVLGKHGHRIMSARARRLERTRDLQAARRWRQGIGQVAPEECWAMCAWSQTPVVSWEPGRCVCGARP